MPISKRECFLRNLLPLSSKMSQSLFELAAYCRVELGRAGKRQKKYSFQSKRIRRIRREIRILDIYDPIIPQEERERIINCYNTIQWSTGQYPINSSSPEG